MSDKHGVVLIAAITIAVAGWLYSQRPEAKSASSEAALSSARPPLADDALPELVEIPAGPFRMGSEPGIDPLAYDNERWSSSSKQGTVEVPAFYIGRYEVTVGQFRAFVEATSFSVDGAALEGSPDQPVASVSWPDALAYCRWLETALLASPQTPPSLRTLLSDGWQVTLPTEAQWEKAARGPDARIFPWGDEASPDRANYRRSSTSAVGSFACPECAFGLSDMSGNVWELTRSPYRPYPYRATIDDIDLDADALWVMRGGSYTDTEQNVRAATRGGADPGARRPFIGFRVVVVRPRQSEEL